MSHPYSSIYTIRLLVGLLCLLIIPLAQSQDVQSIDLETVLQLSGANNLTIKEYNERRVLADAEYTTAKSWWLPEIYAGVQTQNLWGAAMNTDGRFSLETNRDNLWAGLGLNVHWDLAEGIYNVQSAKHHLAAQQYRSEVQRQATILESIEAYYGLLGAQLEYVAYNDLAKQSDSLSQQIDILVEAGLAYQSESLLARSNLANIHFKSYQSQMEMTRKSSQLRNLLNLNPHIGLICHDTLLIPLELVDELIAIDFTSVHNQRPELSVLESEGRALISQRKKFTTGLAIPSLRLDAFQAYFGDLDGSVEALRPDLFPTTQQLYSTQNINASLLWRVPLSVLTHGGEIKTYDAKLRLGQIKIEQQKADINQEVIEYRENAILAKEQMELASQASSLARDAVNQSMQRQQLGTVRPFEIIQSQEVFITSRLNYIKAVSQYNILQYKLYLALGNTL